MAKTLADEYHGHKCHQASQRRVVIADMADPEWLSEKAEDLIADELYMAGHMNRSEWLLAKERMRETFALPDAIRHHIEWSEQNG